MHGELIEHAARVLRNSPARALGAASLYGRVSTETGIHCGLSLFLDRLRSCPERFTLLPAVPGLPDAASWTSRERRAYAGVLPVGRLSNPPMVALCEVTDVTDEAWAPVPTGSAEGGSEERLGDVHRSVAELLHGCGEDAGLRAAVATAVTALGGAAARSTTAPLRPPPRRGDPPCGQPPA